MKDLSLSQQIIEAQVVSIVDIGLVTRMETCPLHDYYSSKVPSFSQRFKHLQVDLDVIVLQCLIIDVILSVGLTRRVL